MRQNIPATPRFSPWCLVASPLLALGVVSGCSQSDFGSRPEAESWGDYDDGGGRPGDKARDADPEIVCDTNRDCGAGEACIDGICQMSRCEDAYTSRPPLRPGLRFFVDREIAVADGSDSVAAFDPSSDALNHQDSWSSGGGGVTDLASGTFFEDSAEASVVVRADSRSIALANASRDASVTLSYMPVAVTAGDVNGNGSDEVIALGQFGNVSVCDMATETCESFTLEGDGLDVTSGDVDADGFVESILLLQKGDQKMLYIWNHDKNKTGQDDYWGNVDEHIFRIDAGDFDGDGMTEIAALSAPRHFGFTKGKLFLMRADGGVQTVQEQEVEKTALDIAAGDFDMDKQDELVVLHEGNQVQVMRPSKKTLAVTPESTRGLSNVGSAQRIAMGDFDGDSPRARLMSEVGELLPGPVAPSIAIHFPPYDAERSTGTSGTFVGNAETMSENFEDSVALKASATVGVSAELPSVLGAGLSTTIGYEVRRSTGTTSSYLISSRTVASPSEDMEGYPHAAMLLTCACYHVYRYEIDDPAGRLELSSADANSFVVVLPVGGTVTAWSSRRYNMMAEALGGLPIMEIPYEVGNPSSYPSGPQRGNGEPIAAADMVFPKVPSLLTSDVGGIGWWLSVEESETNSESISHSWDISASLDVGPFNFGLGGGMSESSSYSVTVGKGALFGGSVPPIEDDPATPEDEYHEYAFNFSPYVYREHYTNAEGKKAGYYVMSFAVGKEQ